MKTLRFVCTMFYLVALTMLLPGCPDEPQYGSLTVVISPCGAIDDGAQWRVNNGMWQNSGSTVAALPPGDYRVSFNAVNGWISPPDQTATIRHNKEIPVAGIYQPRPVTQVSYR